MAISRIKLLAACAVAVALPLAIASKSFAAGESDALRAMLEDSKVQQKGLTFYVSGVSVPGIVVNVTDKYVVAKSQAQGTIVLRLDRIDGVSGFVGEKK
jgi:ABC-type sulfate transport system permease subunit